MTSFCSLLPRINNIPLFLVGFGIIFIMSLYDHSILSMGVCIIQNIYHSSSNSSPLIDKICEATKDKKQYIQMTKFISLVTTSLKPPFYNDIIKIILCPACWRYQGHPWIHYFDCLSIAVCPMQFFSNVFDLSCNVLAIIHRITGDILLEGVLPPGRVENRKMSWL
jgi:hypothetical protein